MNFMQWLNSLDELLYEVMSWFVFFPLTLWRAVTQPLALMRYVDVELHEKDEEQFTDTISPPLFLVLSLLVSQGTGMALGGGTNPIVSSAKGLARLIQDDTTLLMLKLVFFSIFPLMLAVRFLKASGSALTRQRLKTPFYAQCYATGPFALSIGVGTALASIQSSWVATAGNMTIAFGVLTYVVVQVLWFARHLQSGIGRGLYNAGLGLAGGLVLALAVAFVFTAPLLP